jgi:hypothetical protein|tara:strand:- start:6932 stop:7090 length:159 start_codon:yes stop_codon:yes gene_type:complete
MPLIDDFAAMAQSMRNNSQPSMHQCEGCVNQKKNLHHQSFTNGFLPLSHEKT